MIPIVCKINIESEPQDPRQWTKVLRLVKTETVNGITTNTYSKYNIPPKEENVPVQSDPS